MRQLRRIQWYLAIGIGFSGLLTTWLMLDRSTPAIPWTVGAAALPLPPLLIARFACRYLEHVERRYP